MEAGYDFKVAKLNLLDVVSEQSRSQHPIWRKDKVKAIRHSPARQFRGAAWF